MPFVFAYGSNMQSAQMRARAPSSRLVGRAHLLGASLSFRSHSYLWRGAVADVTLASPERHEVPGVLWHVGSDDLDALDAYEGVPFTYDRIALPPHRLRGSFGLLTQAYVLATSEPARLPSPSYLARIIEGRLEHGLPVDDLHETMRSVALSRR